MRFKLFIPVLFSGCFFITACSTPYVGAEQRIDEKMKVKQAEIKAYRGIYR